MLKLTTKQTLHLKFDEEQQQNNNLKQKIEKCNFNHRHINKNLLYTV